MKTSTLLYLLYCNLNLEYEESTLGIATSGSSMTTWALACLAEGGLNWRLDSDQNSPVGLHALPYTNILVILTLAAFERLLIECFLITVARYLSSTIAHLGLSCELSGSTCINPPMLHTWCLGRCCWLNT